MAVLSPVQRLVSNGTSVFIAADRTAAVAAAISGSGTLATVVPRYVAWPGLERLTNDNNSFFAPFGEPQCIWDTTATDGQTRGFATASNPFTLTGTSELAVSLAAFADNALEAQIDLVDAATSAIVSAPPLGVLLTDGSMDPASGTTTDINPPFNWQNIRFYSVNSGAIPAGTYKVVVSFRGVNYNRASGTVNPAALAFVADVYSGRSSLAPFSGGLEVLEKTAVFNLQPVYGLSALRDVASTTGSGTAANAGDGYMLVTTNDGTDSATLDSAERGRYEPGYASQAGIGVQLPVPPAGNQVARWGYFDDQNGAFWGRDVTNGIFVAVRRLGVDTIIPQSAWNVDKLDGTGPSGFVLDLAAGNIFEIDFTWYGFGVAEFSVLIRDPASGVQKKAAAHRFMPAGQTSFVDPNLPVRAQIQNNGTASAIRLFVTGRQ